MSGEIIVCTDRRTRRMYEMNTKSTHLLGRVIVQRKIYNYRMTMENVKN